VLPVLEPGTVEIVTDGGAKYMEFVFKLPPGWDGQADAGYIDNTTAPTMIIWIEHSIDLVTWTQGVFFDSPTAWTTDVFGWSIVRARSLYVQDVAVKQGDLVWHIHLNAISGDFATIESGKFDGSDLSLSYPYNLNLNASRSALQSDLRLAGFPGASVSLASSIVTIVLPNITLASGFGGGAFFKTDPQLYYDLWHNIQYMDSQHASLEKASAPGYEFRNDTKQFCRLRVVAP
jgi:hypothetical protein